MSDYDYLDDWTPGEPPQDCCPGCANGSVCYYVTQRLGDSSDWSEPVRPAGQKAYEWLRENDPDEYQRVPDPFMN